MVISNLHKKRFMDNLSVIKKKMNFLSWFDTVCYSINYFDLSSQEVNDLLDKTLKEKIKEELGVTK